MLALEGAVTPERDPTASRADDQVVHEVDADPPEPTVLPDDSAPEDAHLGAPGHLQARPLQAAPEQAAPRQAAAENSAKTAEASPAESLSETVASQPGAQAEADSAASNRP